MTRDQALLKQFGRNVQRIRQDRNMSQAEFAEAAQVSHTSVGFIETGKRWPRLSTLEKFAQVLDVKIVDFFVSVEDQK